MKAVDSAIGEIGGTMTGVLHHGCGQHDAIIEIDRWMFFGSVMGLIIHTLMPDVDRT